ncbi:MAG: hypothetical protein IPH35_27265 [Rhodoferax sp.]|nr:hypothetical protein [Rhodoferax sp.]
MQTLIGWLNDRSTQPPLLEANRSAIAAQQYADNTLRNAEVVHSMGMLHAIHTTWLERQRKFLGLQATASNAASAFQSMGGHGSRSSPAGYWPVVLGLAQQPAQWGWRDDDHCGSSIIGGRCWRPLTACIPVAAPSIPRQPGAVGSAAASLPAKTAGMPCPRPKGHLLVENLVAGALVCPCPSSRAWLFPCNRARCWPW